MNAQFLFKHILLFILTGLSFQLSSQNTSCANADPFCTDAGITFPANSDGTGSGNGPQASTVDPGNDYGCLGTTGNPAWFYLEVDDAGVIIIDLSNSNNVDIDFALWGPFANLATATASCGSLGTPTDCSYSVAADETVNVPNSSTGDVYLMLITNYANTPTDITAQQTGGGGSTDCTILPPCAPDAGTVTTSTTGTGSGTNSLVLCVGNTLNITSDNNYVLPPPFTGEVSELMYAIYDSAPPASPDPEVDTEFSGLFWTAEDIDPTNAGGTNDVGGIPTAYTNAGVTGTNGTTIWLVPVTVDDSDDAGNPNGIINLDQNGDDCYDVGTPVQITYLEEISYSALPACDNNTGNGTVDVTITGGLAPYTLVNTGDGTINTTNVPTDGGAVTFTVSDGDDYSFSLSDANGCLSSYSGSFVCIVSTTSGCTNTTDFAIPDNISPTTAISPIVNSGSTGTLGAGTEILEVCVLIEHPFIGDLSLVLDGPTGSFIFLSNQIGGGGDDYGDVAGAVEMCFTPTATNPISGYTGGQVGNFLPGEPFSDLDGENPNGTWDLYVYDSAGGDIGTLLSWSITFSNGNCSPVCDISNEDCAAPSVVSLVSGVENCVDGCTIGASDDSGILGNGCDDINGAAVWYQFTTVDYALLVEATSSDMSDIQLQLWTDCGTYLAGGCETGSSGISNIVSTPGTGETYLLSVSSASGTEGYFELCITSYPDPSPCNINNTLVATPPATDFPNDMYPPGTTVEFCYDLIEFQKANCNYLHGLVPTWGDCWTTAVGTEPTITTAIATSGANLANGSPYFGATSGTWSWYADGVVTYNDIPNGALPLGTPVGAGWFFNTTYDSYQIENGMANPDPTDPNNSYGDGFMGSPADNCDVTIGLTMDWQVCFELTTNDFTGLGCTNGDDCSVSIKTYGDGETGVWTNEGCFLDVPTTLIASQCCVDPVTLTDDDECEGNTITFPSGYVGTGTVNWYDAATGGIPIAAGVDFTTPTLAPGTYTYYAEVTEMGCTSTRTPVDATINPLPSVTFNTFDQTVCPGENIAVTATVVDGTIVSWTGEGTSGTSAMQTFTPTSNQTYSITLSSTLGCTPDVTVDIPIGLFSLTTDAGQDLTLCQGHTAYLGASAFDGDGTYSYSWSGGLGAGRTHAVTVGATGSTTYTVTVTDGNSCTATDEVVLTSTGNAAPTFDNCPSTDVTANNDMSVCNANVTLPTLTATDDCVPPTITSSAATGTMAFNYYGIHNGHYYYISALPITPASLGVATEAAAMAQANDAAQEFTGYLATIDNAAENDFVKYASLSGANPIVFGYTDEGLECSFGWFGGCCGAGGSGYTNWTAGEPNDGFTACDGGGLNSASNVENYVEISKFGTWNDFSLTSGDHFALIELNVMPEDIDISCDEMTGTFPVGTTTVTCTATDWFSPLETDCVYDVVVSDNEDPNPICQDITINVSSGSVTITTAQIDNGSTDNCGIMSMSLSPNTFDCTDEGDYTVTLTVNDVNGNSATCDATVTVEAVDLEFFRD